MNYAKIAAALHAFADALLEGVEDPKDQPAKPKGKKSVPADVSAPVAPTAAAAAPAPASAPAPSVTKEQVNKLVLAVAAKNRDAAVAILNKFNLANTVTLAPELWQAVYDAFEEELAKIDAAAVQVAQASLV